MNTTLDIAMPVHPAVLSVFLGLIAVALIYYAVKFVLSLVTGG